MFCLLRTKKHVPVGSQEPPGSPGWSYLQPSQLKETREAHSLVSLGAPPPVPQHPGSMVAGEALGVEKVLVEGGSWPVTVTTYSAAALTNEYKLSGLRTGTHCLTTGLQLRRLN